MAPRILATGSNIDFVNSVIKILPEDSAPVYCPAVYTSLKEAASSMTVDYLLLCLDQERDNTISTYRRLLREKLVEGAEIVIVGKGEACRVLSKEPLFINARFFERPINVNDFREILSRPVERVVEEPAPEEPVYDEPIHEEDSGVARKKHILIVDDELQQVILIKNLLSGYYTVTAVTNGPDARKYLSKHSCDLILLDYVMAGENGLETFHLLKENPATANIPVIFLTSVNDADTVRSIVTHKPEGYLVKPVKRADLVSRIIDVLDAREAADRASGRK